MNFLVNTVEPNIFLLMKIASYMKIAAILQNALAPLTLPSCVQNLGKLVEKHKINVVLPISEIILQNVYPGSHSHNLTNFNIFDFAVLNNY